MQMMFSGKLTVYFNCKYFPQCTRKLLERLLGISPAGAKSKYPKEYFSIDKEESEQLLARKSCFM